MLNKRVIFSFMRQLAPLCLNVCYVFVSRSQQCRTLHSRHSWTMERSLEKLIINYQIIAIGKPARISLYEFPPQAGKIFSSDTTVISQTDIIGKQTLNLACMQLHANMCPRKIRRCYKIGEINACTYPYIAQINKLLLEPE